MDIRRIALIAAIIAIIAPAKAPAQAIDPPNEVAAIEKVATEWFKACSTGDIAQLRARYHPDARAEPEKQVEQLARLLAVAPNLEFKLMLAKYSSDQAEAISYPFKIDHPEASDEAVIILHLKRANDTWKVLYNSGDALRAVPNGYDHFKRKYPDGVIWVDPAAPAWIKPEKSPEKGQLTVEEIFKDIPQSYPAAAIVEKLEHTVYDQTVFESWFPDDPEAARTLLELYRNKGKDPNSPENILSAARGGMRNVGSQGPYIVSFLGNKYIWGATSQNPDAVELMYYASFRKDLVGNAIYYGLSVVKPPRSPKILERCVELCMIDQSVGRILWGTRSQHNEMLPYLKPWLNHADVDISNRAAVIEKVLKGQLDYDQYTKQRKFDHDKALLGDKVPQIKRVLAEGSSSQRRKMFDQIKRRGLHSLFDDSFTAPLLACLTDGHPEVRCYAITFSGDLFCKPKEVKPEIIDLMDDLSKDSDSKVRDAVAVFAGSKWVWGSDPQHPQAIEIMMRLAKDKDREVRNNAIYYGLSVLIEKDDRAIKTMIDLALDRTAGADLGRIAWGLSRGADKDKIKALLDPHLKGDSEKSELARKLYAEIFEQKQAD